MKNKWTDRFINLALTISSWSKDTTHVGCVIVNNENKVRATGYNGMPSWYRDSNLPSLKENKGRMISHAEINCFNCLHPTHYNEELYLYVTKPMCKWCALAIIGSIVNIKKVYYLPSTSLSFEDKYCTLEALEILESNNIETIQVVLEGAII